MESATTRADDPGFVPSVLGKPAIMLGDGLGTVAINDHEAPPFASRNLNVRSPPLIECLMR